MNKNISILHLKLRAFYLSLGFLFFIYSCDSIVEQEKVINLVLNPTNSLTSIGDSILIGPLSSVVVQEDIIMLAEGNKSRVLVLDTNFKLKYILGNYRGSGPGEFNYVFNPIVKNGRIYAYDEGNQRINVFSKKNGEYIKNIKLKVNPTTKDFYLDNNNNIYFATDPSPDGKMLVKLDSNGYLLNKFGKNLIENKDKTVQMNSNYRELIVANNRIISIGVSVGIVEIHDLNGNEINSFDISQNEPMKTALKLLQKEIKATSDQIHVINSNCYFRDNILYISTSDRVENRREVKHLMCFKLSDKSCKFIKTIKLNGNTNDNSINYDPLYITENSKNIYAQGLITKQLYTFKMP